MKSTVMARFQSCNTHMVSIHPYGEARTENAALLFLLVYLLIWD